MAAGTSGRAARQGGTRIGRRRGCDELARPRTPGGLFGRSASHALLADLGLPVLIVPASALVPSDGFRRVLATVRSEDELQAAAAAIHLLRPPIEVAAVHVPGLVAAHSGSAQSNAFIETPEVSGGRRRFVRPETLTNARPPSLR